MIRDSQGRPVFHYRQGAPKIRAKRQTPEADLQKAVVEYLTYALPRGVYRIRAGTEGAKRTGRDRTDFKAMAGAKGWPDLMLFNRQTRAVRWLELKSDKGRLTPEQAELHAELRDHVRVCRSVEDVEAALISWGLTPATPISKAHRYAVPD